MPLLPSSPRARARLLRRTAAGAVVLVVALLLVFDRNAGHSLQTPTTDEPAVVVREPKAVPAAAADTRSAMQTLRVFARSAIIRRDLDASWLLADAHMKEGVTHRDWLAGNLPVVPYDAAAFAGAGFTLKYSYRAVLGYDVLILPKPTKAGAAAGQQVYSCELHRERGRWLVEFCYPRKTL